MLGSLGNVVFEVSDQKVRTFQDFRRSGSARFATHEVLGRKPVKEFIGQGTEEVGFSVRLDVAHGVKPEEELAVLRQMRDGGQPVELIIGQKPVGQNLWVLTSLNETWSHLDNQGNVLVAQAELSLEEYYRKPQSAEGDEGGQADGA